MGFSRTMRRQNAVYWPFVSANAAGDPRVGEPVELLAAERNGVYWDWRRSEVRDPNGAIIATDADVFAGVEIAIGSMMWLGLLDDLAGTSETPTTHLCQVVRSDIIPDVKGRTYGYELRLMRYHGTLPEIV